MKFTWEKYLEREGLKMEDLKQDAEALAKHFNAFNEEKNAERDEAIQDKASKSEIVELQKELSKIKDEQMKHLNDALKAQGLEITKLKGGNLSDKKVKPIASQIAESLKANIEGLKTLKTGTKVSSKEGEFDFTIKAPATMTFGTNVSGGNIPVEDRLEGFNIIPSRAVRLLDLVSSRTTSSNIVSWVYQANKDGAAGQTAEASTKNQVDFDLVVANEAIKKTTAYIKVSTEMLDDIEWLRSEINNELLRELLKVVELQTYSGDGTGQNHNGIRTVASAFAAGSFALSVDNANIVDVLTVAADQIMVAQEGNVSMSDMAILMYPSDVTSLKLEKITSTDKRYVERLQQIGGSLSMDGIPIIQTTLVTQGEYLIGDFMKAMSVTREGIRVEIGLDGTDFTDNVRTILAEWRGLTLVKNNDRSAFVAGVFATDIAALETP